MHKLLILVLRNGKNNHLIYRPVINDRHLKAKTHKFLEDEAPQFHPPIVSDYSYKYDSEIKMSEDECDTGMTLLYMCYIIIIIEYCNIAMSTSV